MLLTRFKIIITTLYTTRKALLVCPPVYSKYLSIHLCLYMCANGLQIKDIAKNEQQLVAKSFVSTHKRIRRYSTN